MRLIYRLLLRPHAGLANAQEQSNLLGSDPNLSLKGGHLPCALQSVTCTMSGIGRRLPACTSLTDLQAHTIAEFLLCR